MDIQDNQKDEGKQQASGNVDPEDNEAHGLEGWDDDEDYKDSEDEGTEEIKGGGGGGGGDRETDTGSETDSK
eukprot:scaffold3564_cov162-Amphora_coffeaeformis.AAC.3